MKVEIEILKYIILIFTVVNCVFDFNNFSSINVTEIINQVKTNKY